MEEEEDADLQEAIRRSMDDYHAMHAATAASAYTSWSPGTPVEPSSASRQLRQQPPQRSFPVPVQQQQQQQYRHQTHVPLHQQQLRSPSSSSHHGAGGATLRGPVGLWEGAYSSSFPASAVTSSPPPLRSSPPSAAAVSPASPFPFRSAVGLASSPSSPFAYRAVGTASPASPFPLRSPLAAGSGRAAASQSATVSALRENRGGTTAAAAGLGALPAAGRLAAGVHAAGAGEARGYSLSSAAEQTPASLNWLCDPDELFPSRQQQQQQHCHRQPPRQLQQTYSPQRSPVTSLPLSSSLALRQQQPQPPAQLRQLQVSEPYLQLARQQQQLEEQLQQQGGGQEGRYACLVAGASEEEENIALQQAIQESLLTCPSLPSPRRSAASPAAAASGDAAAGRAADGGSTRKGEATHVRQEEEEQLQQQYELHSPSSSRLLSLPTTAAVSTARGYLEDISDLLLPPPQQLQGEDERRLPHRKKSLAQQQQLLQHYTRRTQQQEKEEETETTTGAAAAGEVLSGRKASTDRCKTPLSWIREEEAEEGAVETLAPSSSLSSADKDADGDSCVSAGQPDAAAGSGGVAARKTAAHEEGAAAAQQQQSSTDTSRSSSNQDDNNSRMRGTRRNEEEMRKVLLQQMQPLPAAPDLKELLDVVFGEEGVNREIDPGDFSRWFHHPFLFAGDVLSRYPPMKRKAETQQCPAASPPEEEEDAECKWLLNSSTQWKENAGWCSWGLVQLHGGPCGLLAAVQCFLLRALLFSPGRVKRYTHLLMLQRRQRHTQQQTQQQQAEQQHHTQQPPQTEQQQQQQQLETAAGEEQEAGKDGMWPRGGRQGAVASSLSSSKHTDHNRSGDGSANKCTGQRCGDWNVELLSLLPSPLTRRHALIEAVAAVLYQSTPVSLYTVAYVLPADIEELQQPAAAAAEEAEALLHAEDDGTGSRERRRSSSSVHAAAADEGQSGTAAAARDIGVEADEPGSSREAKRGQGTQKNARKKVEVKEGVSEMLEDVRVSIRRFRRIEDVMHFYNLFYDVLLAGETGVISFLFSVLLTRGVQQVVNDMDMPGHSLIGVYGHCSQDLVNLLLLGAASSNVFDGDRKLGSSTTSASSTHAKEKAEGATAGKERRRDGRAAEGAAAEAPLQEKREKISLTDEEKEEKQEEEEQTHLKGVRKRPLAGFLSEMEALRYCEVGSRYKHPHFPLWVVGSSNHYATLFSRDLLAAAVPSARLAEIEAQAAFRDFDRDGNFLILTEHLAALLTQLGQQERLIEAQRATCAAEGVVLLSDFLKWYSKVVIQQRSQSGEEVEPPKKFTLYIYDGQTPPGPSLRRFLVEASSSNSSNTNEEVEAGEMRRLLSTRWPAAAVSELPLLPLHLSTNA